jgi:hypothetical protein
MAQTELRNPAKKRQAIVSLFQSHTPPTMFLRDPGEIRISEDHRL